ncbi:DNA-processing protein DprA [Maritimibacter fusiformis]|uniref:DNA-protecting protein DprA n=1 Tax=Maritimibacter fusiformis TaxID=2603819 RepID=A0A5D0RM47_9RHOB|nr:DNA-processing protein DprA [Maritimibacter fusiformis]TYB82523.1 DNA-protecting protein DprA [Maritimibacter fusiformis]
MVGGQETESGRPVDHIPFPHPLTPPRSEEDALAWLRLLRSRRVGVATFFRLMREHGTAQAALAALPEVAKAAGVEDYRACSPEAARREAQAARHAGAEFIAFGDPRYPRHLAEISDPPPFFWAIGDLSLLTRPTVAMVGARNASSLGTRMARRLAQELGAAGNVIVSGLARGIDTAAHKAALETGTIAVMAGGVDVIYPTENTVLGEEIGRGGLRLSEAPMGHQPQARNFPQRNRIISGLARAVVVVEAAARSGSLITARAALDQGREVLAVPGHPFDARASGCNMLIRDGATLVRGAQDVIEMLDTMREPELALDTAPEIVEIPAPPPETRTPAETRALHQQILNRLGPSPVAEDQLIRDLAVTAAEAAPELVTLELDGRIQRQPGGLINRLN